VEQVGEKKNTNVKDTSSQAGSLPLTQGNDTALKDILFICQHVSALRKNICVDASSAWSA
jgi:hypothetical protein